jgi:hypothetical protein
LSVNKPTRIPLPFRRPSLPPVTAFRKRQAYIEIMGRTDLTEGQKATAIEMLRQIPTEGK